MHRSVTSVQAHRSTCLLLQPALRVLGRCLRTTQQLARLVDAGPIGSTGFSNGKCCMETLSTEAGTGNLFCCATSKLSLSHVSHASQCTCVKF